MNYKEKRFTTTKVIVFIQYSMSIAAMVVFIYAAINLIDILKNSDWKLSTMASNPLFTTYSALLTQSAAVVATTQLTCGYIVKFYMNKSSTENIFKQKNGQILFKLRLKRRMQKKDCQSESFYTEKDMNDDLAKIDSYIDRAEDNKIKKVLDEDISTKIT